ncbi:tetratricopeptide repeat protein [Frankia sp. Ag45/Mut15]|uniref:Tetratricopeptide repeat protein n=1 Tax=Frankia umida TaxID=573489 RepID=A0ABT0JZ01_9ACTN|nr:toll/interleukin-1 receptor domain-containing protein [Frankia umida]MCK9876761.1 tetratricopeptide repeat protein [Frankia umida]
MTGGGGEGAPDCFVSYAQDARPWAEWIAHTLESEGLRVAIDCWDVVPGTHRIAWLDRSTSDARQTIAVVSDGYLRSTTAVDEWAVAWSARRDSPGRPKGDGGPEEHGRRLLVARVTDQPIPGLLGQIAPIDLANLSARVGREALLGAVWGDRPGRDTREARVGAPPRHPYLAPHPSELPAVWNVPTPPAALVGREASLARVDAALARAPLVAVTGLAGVGKTSLATAYVHAHRAEFDAVWWVPAARPQLLDERIRALAPELGLPTHAQPAAVLAQLDRADARWLIVLDNAPDAALPRWLPVPGPSGSGRVLVTSRNPDWERLGMTVALAPLERRESVALLTDRVTSIEATVAGRIAEQLGDHPLALDQAAHRILAGRLPAETYLAELIRAPRRLLAEGEAPGRPGITAANLWDESLRALAADSPTAVELLRLVARADAQGLPLRLLTADPLTLTDPLALADTVGALERSGLAHRDGPSVTAHRLVRAAVRADTDPDHATDLTHTLRRLLRTALPEQITATPDAWPAWRELLPHVLASLDGPDDADDTDGTEGRLAAARTGADDDLHAAWLAEHAAAYLVEHGQGRHALPLALRAVETRGRLQGPEHPDTLTAGATVIHAAIAADRLAEAGPLATQLLTERRRILGQDHPDTLASEATLTTVYERVGRFDRALELIPHTLADRTRLLGAEHPDTLATRHQLGRAHDGAGHPDQALELLRAVRTDRRRLLGEDHPATLETTHQLAVTYSRRGASGDALPLLERTLTARTTVLGEDHPDTLHTQHRLGVDLARAGRRDEAEGVLDDAARRRDRVLGPEHSDTVESVFRLAQVHVISGRLETAVPRLERVLAAGKGRDGPAYPATNPARELLAATYLRLDRPSDAVPHLEVALDRHVQVLGEAHRKTTETRADLATALRRNGQYEEAIPHVERALEHRARTTGLADSRTLRTADDLITIYRAADRRHLPRAIGLSEQILAVRREVLGRPHPDTRDNEHSLGELYRLAGRPQAAVDLYRDASRERMREEGPFHPDTIRARRALGDAIQAIRQERGPAERPFQPEPRRDHW